MTIVSIYSHSLHMHPLLLKMLVFSTFPIQRSDFGTQKWDFGPQKRRFKRLKRHFDFITASLELRSRDACGIFHYELFFFH